MTPPLVLDIDGTMTRPDGGDRSRAIDPRVFDVLANWDEVVVIATGKAFPYPVALSAFLGVPERVIAENGGVVYADGQLRITGNANAARSVVEEYEAAGYSTGWGPEETVNRWRETEVAVSLDQPEAPLRAIANAHGLQVLDTGYAYHVLDPAVNKGRGLETMCELLDRDPAAFVAVGDSENDAPTFDVVGRSFAVANADETAKRAADEQTSGAHADGLLEALAEVE